MPHALPRTEHSTTLLSPSSQSHSHSHSRRHSKQASEHMLPLLDMEAPPHPQSSKQQHRLMRTVSISMLVMSLPVLYVSFLHVPPAALFRDTTFWFLMSNSIIIVIAADSGMLFFGSSAAAADDAEAGDGGLELSFVVAAGAEQTVADIKSSTGAVSVADEVEVEEVIKNQALVVQELGGDQLAVVAAENHHAYALVENRHREIVTSPSAADYVAAARLTESRSLAARRRHGHGHRPSRSSHALVPVQDKSVVVVSDEKLLRRTETGRDRRPPPSRWAAAEESEYSRMSDEELNQRVEEFITRFNREMRLQQEEEGQAAAA